MRFEELFDGHLVLAPQGDLAQATLELPTCGGVCLFLGDDDQPILLINGANLRNLVRRKLSDDHPDEKTKRTKLRPIVKKIMYRQSYSRFENQLHYFQIARAVYPDTYDQLFPSLDVWFIHVNLDDKYPVFTKTNKCDLTKGRYWGPLPTNRSASNYLEILQSCFDLCRCPHLIAQAPNATPCSYAQMNRCCTVCDGSATRDEYLATIENTINFLSSSLPKSIDAMKLKMKELSDSLQFEQAQRVHHKITELTKLLAPAYRWVGPLENFCVLAFQNGPAVKVPQIRAAQKTITPFIVTPNQVSQIAPFLPSEIKQLCQTLPDHINLAQLQLHQQNISQLQQHLFAWITQTLYKKTTTGELFITAEQLTKPEELTKLITKHFE